MDYKIIWAESAIANPGEICSYIAKDNPRAAQRVGQAILDAVKKLESFPELGPHYPRGSSGSLREIVHANYRIFYEISERTRSVEILYVWHGALGEPPPMG